MKPNQPYMKPNALVYSLAFSLASLLLSGCSKNEPGEHEVRIEEINLGKALMKVKTDMPLSEVADQIKYIPLETKEECIIDQIGKIVTSGEFLFVATKVQLFQFTLGGKFVKTFGSKGKGPGEYTEVTDFSVGSHEGKVSIYDRELKKVIHYDVEGNFENEYLIEGYPKSVAYSPGGTLHVAWVFPNFVYNNNFAVNAYGEDGKITRQTIDRSDEGITESIAYRLGSTGCVNFGNYSDTLTFFEANNEIIYRILENGEPIPRYRIIPNSNQTLEEKNSSKLIPENFRTCYFIEAKRFIFMPKGVYQNKVFHVLYDKKTKEISTFRLSHPSMRLQIEAGFINDIDGGYPFSPLGIVSPSEAYCTFYASDLEKLQSDDFFKNVVPKDTKARAALLELISKSSPEDNPVIMVVKLKGV